MLTEAGTFSNAIGDFLKFKERGKVDRFLNHAAVMLSLDPLHKQHCLGNLGTGVKNENKQIGFRDINPLFVIQANIYMTTN